VVPGILASFEPVIHALAGKLILRQGILPGVDRPPTIFLASFINILLFYFLIVAVPWRLRLAACFFFLTYPELWSLQLFSIHEDPRAKFGPFIRHDFELGCDG
jgi:hypothetical protein